MFNKITKVEDVLKFELINNLIVLISRKNRNLIVYSNLIEEWRTNEKNYNCAILDNKILTTNIKLYSLEGGVIYDNKKYNDYSFEIADYESNVSIWKTIDYEKEKVLYHLFDVTKQKMIVENISIDSAIPAILANDFLIAKETSNIYLYKKNGIELFWKKDLTHNALYNHWDGNEKIGEIKKVYSSDKKILVLTTCVLICLDFGGNILYEVRFPDLLRAQTLVVNEHRAYVYNYHDYVVVDLQKGKLILHKEIGSFVYQGEKYNNFAQDLTYHQGLLYHSVNSSGISFVVAINPITGDTVWRQHLTGQSINSICFHEDKMYILDGGNTLHIFENEAKSQNGII